MKYEEHRPEKEHVEEPHESCKTPFLIFPLQKNTCELLSRNAALLQEFRIIEILKNISIYIEYCSD